MVRRSLQPFVRVLVALFVLAQLAGCASWDRFRESELGAQQLLNPQRITPKNPRTTAEIGDTWEAGKARPSEYSLFYQAEFTAQKDNTPDAVTKYVNQGIVLSDTVCNAWFDLLEETQANVEFTKNNTVIAAATATTIMGAVEAAAKEIAVVAAAFAGASSVLDNYQSSFLFTPDMHTVRKKIDGLREAAVKAMFRDEGNRPVIYEEAKRRLLKYHQICSGAEVRDLIQTAVANTSYKFDREKWTTQLRTNVAQLSDGGRSADGALLEAIDVHAKANAALDKFTASAPADLATQAAGIKALQVSLATTWNVILAAGGHSNPALRSEMDKAQAAIAAQISSADAEVIVASADPARKSSAQALQSLVGELQSLSSRLKALDSAYTLAEARD